MADTKIEEIRKHFGERQFCSLPLAFEREMGDEPATNRTVRLAFASDVPVDHWMGPLILTTKPKAVRQDRMKQGLALLADHDRCEQIGIVENFSFDADGIIRGDARFSKGDDGEEALQDVLDGIKRFVSVGVMIYELHVDNEKDGVITYRCDDWEPFEVSLVSVPADISVGVGRSLEENQVSTAQQRAISDNNTEKTMDTNIEQTPVTPVVDPQAAAAQAREMIRTEIKATADVLGDAALAHRYFQEKVLDERSAEPTVEDFKAFARQALKVAAPQVPVTDPRQEAARQGGPVQLATSAYRGGQLKAFKGEGGHERAYRAGQFLLATIGRQDKAAAYCRENGIAVERAHGGGTNSLGGFLVPEEFDATMIDLRIQYGVFRRNANVVPMSSDTKSRPRRTGGLTAYFRSSGTATTESTKSWDEVTLVAKLCSVLTKYENELSEDAVINIGDDLVSEIAYAFAAKEDDCGFNGDGTDTYGGIVGARNKILNLGATRANIAGAQVATGNLWSEIVLADLQALSGKLPQFARQSGNVKYYCSQEFYSTVLMRLAQAVGGVTATEIANGFGPSFFGVPVEITEAMPHTEANDVICLLYGNLAQAAMFGDRKGTSIAMTDSDSTDFAKGIMAIRGDTRFDINVHDVGNYHATAASRTPGPIVGLLTAAS